MNISNNNNLVKPKTTTDIFICWYDFGQRWLFVELHEDGTLQVSEYNYPTESWCREMVEALQTECNCAPWANVHFGGYCLPRDWKTRKFHPSFN